MKVKYIFLLFVPFFCLTSCVFLDTHYTYKLENPDDKENNSIEKLIIRIGEKTLIKKGYSTLVGKGKYILKEPYELIVAFDNKMYEENIEKINIDKVLLIKKNESINIRNKSINIDIASAPVYFFHKIDEENMLLFKNYGLIDISRQRKEEDRWSSVIRLTWTDIDVVYKKDRNFSIEIDLTIEWKDGKKENKSIVANFKRKKYTTYESIIFLLSVQFWGWLLSLSN